MKRKFRYPFFVLKNYMRRIFLLSVLLIVSVSTFGQNTYTIQQYLNIKSASSPSFSANGKRVIYLTNNSGTSQVWAIDLPNGAPKQLTKYDDNISFARFSPTNDDEIVFGKAVGGNENTQFYAMKADGSNVRELTANPQIRYNFGDWSNDGKYIYYASNKRDKNFFDVYAITVADGKEELIYQQDGNNNFAAVSKDGSKIIISRSGTELALDNNLYLIDAATKKETLLTAHTGASEFGDAHFLKNDLIVMTSDEGQEFSNLEFRNLKSNKTLPFEKTVWGVESLAVSSENNGFAYTKNREGYSELYIADSRAYQEKNATMIVAVPKYVTPITLPAKGVVSGLTFSHDQSKIAFTFSSAKYNSDVWMYDFIAQKLTQVTKSSRSDIPPESFVEPQLIKYKSFDGREISAWYYIPKDTVKISDAMYFKREVPKPNQKGDHLTRTHLPVIVSVHGGPEGQERPGFNGLYQYYLSRGYAVLATNVRGSTGYGKTFTHLDDVRKREDSVKDLAFAVEWLKISGGADTKRIAVTGGSYGGYMTLAAITLYPDLFAAAVDTVGIVNWETFLKNTSGYRRRQREVEYGMLDKDIDFLRSISPIAKVDKIKTPLFVIHGKNDPRVPYTEAEQVVKALKDKGAVVEYKLYDDEGHGISKLKNRLDLYPRVADFLDKYMK